VKRAEQAFSEGVAGMDQGRYTEACPKLEESQRLAPASGTLLNLADCYEHLGRTASAWRTFSSAAELAHTAGKLEREQVARQRADALLPALPKLVVAVPIPHPPHLSVTVDGAALPENQWGTPIPVDPGPHTVAAESPGAPPFRAPLTGISAGALVTVNIPASSAPSPLTPRPIDGREPSADHGMDGQELAAVASASIGLIGVVAGTAFGLHSKSKHDQSDEHCPGGNTCADRAGVELMNDARAAGDRATLSFIVGGVGLGAAAVLWFAHPFGSRENEARVDVGLGRVQLRTTW
jgi:hypothetical protein